MLSLNPQERITAANALTHSFVWPYHDVDDEPVAHDKFDWSFNDGELPLETWKVLM